MSGHAVLLRGPADPASLAVIERLTDTFGGAAIRGLLQGLHDLLERACRSDDPAALAQEAHRIAGLAGTLGFAALGQQWLLVADGRGPVTDATLTATRQALSTIEHAKNKAAFTAA